MNESQWEAAVQPASCPTYSSEGKLEHRCLPSCSLTGSGSLPSVTDPRSTRKGRSQSQPEEARLSVPQDDKREEEWDLLSSGGLVIDLNMSWVQTGAASFYSGNWAMMRRTGLESVSNRLQKYPVVLVKVSHDLLTWGLVSRRGGESQLTPAIKRRLRWILTELCWLRQNNNSINRLVNHQKTDWYWSIDHFQTKVSTILQFQLLKCENLLSFLHLMWQ